eukprot:SM000694S20651  [mRNA]  locus=s694:113:1676:+ [translate_table: standard]
MAGHGGGTRAVPVAAAGAARNNGEDIGEGQDLAAIQIGAYVRVHGHLRVFQGRKYLVGFCVRSVTDFNEVTFHNLECIFVHLAASAPAAQPSAAIGASNGPYARPPPYAATPVNPVSGAGAGMGDGQGMDDVQKVVLGFYENPKNAEKEQGISWMEVAGSISGYSRPQIKAAVDFLVNEGQLYSTIDDNHFKWTGA